MHALKKIDTAAHIRQLQLLSGKPGHFDSPGLDALFHNHREFFDELVRIGEVKISLHSIVTRLKAELPDPARIEDEPVALFAKSLPTYLALYANKHQVFKFLLESNIISINQWDYRYKRTCLHWAVIHKRADIVEKLLNHRTAPRPNAQKVYHHAHWRPSPSIQDVEGKTPLHLEFDHKNQEVKDALKASPAFRDYEEKLFKDREIYVQALNAILVCAALIASVTFAGWLQVPSDVFQMLSMKDFWASNSLSFYSAVAAMCITIAALLPTPRKLCRFA